MISIFFPIVEFFAQEQTKNLIADFKSLGLNFTYDLAEKPAEDLFFQDQRFVLTGTLPTLSRAAAREIIEKHGGTVTSAVSGKTDYVLAGENAGSKLDRAQELNIRIISEADLFEMLD